MTARAPRIDHDRPCCDCGVSYVYHFDDPGDCPVFCPGCRSRPGNQQRVVASAVPPPTPAPPAPATPAPPPRPVGVGSPAVLHLHEFGRLIHRLLGVYPWLVGSALRHKGPRDIDVRVCLDDVKFLMAFDALADAYRPGSKWAVLCMALSALGERMTGLPIDFQIQYPGLADRHQHEPRLEIGRDPAH